MNDLLCKAQTLYRRYPLAMIVGTVVVFVMLLPILMPLLLLSVLAIIPLSIGVALGWHWRGHPEKVQPLLEWRDRVADQVLRLARQALAGIERLVTLLRNRLGSGTTLRKTEH